MNYKVLITTAGIGSRLKKLTKDSCKALVPVNGRAAIEYVLDSYDVTVPIVVVLGYQANQVREYLTVNHPERNFDFVEVDKYEGLGSSQLYSMLSAKEKLQCPFVFHACDSIVLEEVSYPNENWVGGYTPSKNYDVSQYRTHKFNKSDLVCVQDKGASTYDSIHIGIVGIKDWISFWDEGELILTSNYENQGLGDVDVINSMLTHTKTMFKQKIFNTWLDTGNLSSLKNTQQFLEKLSL